MSRRFPVKNGIDKTSGGLPVIMIAKLLRKALINMMIIFFYLVYISNDYNHFVQCVTKGTSKLFQRDLRSACVLVVCSIIRIQTHRLLRWQKFKEHTGVIRD